MNALLTRLEAFKSRTLLSICYNGFPHRTTGPRRRKSIPWTRTFRVPGTQAQSELKTVTYESQSTILEDFPPALDNLFKTNANSTFDSDVSNVSSISHSSDSAMVRLLRALRRQNPEQLLEAFFECSTNQSLMRSIPHTTFGEILKLLRPANLIEPYKAVHKDLSATPVTLFGLEPIEHIFEKYFHTVRTVVDLRRRSGSRLSLTDYTLLLECASALGDGPAADVIWSELRRDGLNPDITCYNNYMSAKCWSGLFQPKKRLKAQLTRWYREQGNEGQKIIFQAYDEMVSEGLFGDERTFALLITAMAKKGDTAGMKSVLKHVWNIDTDKVMELEEQGLEPVTQYPKDSPLLPTSDLLFALSHGFGINSDIPTALRLVDYVSRCYELTIPSLVWEELFAWTFALSVPRYGSQRTDESSAGRLPTDSVDNLWRVMTGHPYNVSPAMATYDRYIRNLFSRQKVGEALKRMKEGRILFISSARAFKRAEQELDLAKSIAEQGIEFPVAELSMERLQRKRDYARLAMLRELTFMRRWTRKVLRSTRLLRGGDGSWERKNLPIQIEKWKNFMPRERMRYRTTGGLVQLRHLDLL